jgi:hypothetical protein
MISVQNPLRYQLTVRSKAKWNTIIIYGQGGVLNEPLLHLDISLSAAANWISIAVKYTLYSSIHTEQNSLRFGASSDAEGRPFLGLKQREFLDAKILVRTSTVFLTTFSDKIL